MKFSHIFKFSLLFIFFACGQVNAKLTPQQKNDILTLVRRLCYKGQLEINVDLVHLTNQVCTLVENKEESNTVNIEQILRENSSKILGIVGRTDINPETFKRCMIKTFNPTPFNLGRKIAGGCCNCTGKMVTSFAIVMFILWLVGILKMEVKNTS